MNDHEDLDDKPRLFGNVNSTSLVHAISKAVTKSSSVISRYSKKQTARAFLCEQVLDEALLIDGGFLIKF